MAINLDTLYETLSEATNKLRWPECRYQAGMMVSYAKELYYDGGMNVEDTRDMRELGDYLEQHFHNISDDGETVELFVTAVVGIMNQQPKSRKRGRK